MSYSPIPLASIEKSGSADPGLVDFLESLKDGVAVVDSQRRVAFFNGAYLRQFNLGPDQIRVGDRMEDVMHILAATGMLGVEALSDPTRAVGKRMKDWGSEDNRIERRHCVDGRVLDIYRTPMVDGRTISIHVDVTESVRNAEELERQRRYMEVLLDNTSDGFTLLDGDDRFAIFNDRVLELYDIEPHLVHWGMPYRDFARHFGDLKDLTPDECEREIDSRYRFATDPKSMNVNRKLKDGRTLNIMKRNLPDGGCVMTYRDITEQLAREDQLIDARRVAEDSSRHKSEFVARMSHEMRTPLNGILGVAALLNRTDLSERQLELMRVISNSGNVLLRLIDDILDLSRIDAETFEMVEDRFDIADVVQECIGIIEPGAAEKGLDVRATLPAPTLPMLKGDMIRIKQILLNLLTNAVKFTEQGHIAVTVEAEREEQQMTTVLTIADTGVGIADDKLDQIFNRFYQIDGTVTRRYGGAGLGLAISQKLVDVMGGTIQVDSTLGEGTAFRICLTFPIASRPRRTA